ncbi:N-6 DNA methylase [Metapseudomonas otitidis]|uniref:HsdM family class I SAM-dependent methyltransferase n=1 Tax=Metapseudomonas otitidis TaxID=319939 RepID=UPI003216E62C
MLSHDREKFELVLSRYEDFFSYYKYGFSEFIFILLFLVHFSRVKEKRIGLSLNFLEGLREIASSADEAIGGGFNVADVVNQFLLRIQDGENEKIRDLWQDLEVFFEDGDAVSPGLCFEWAIQYSQAGKKSAEFYTPRALVDLMVKLLKPVGGSSIYDPVCGSGGLLVGALNYINQSKPKERVSLYGRDINVSSARLSKINTYMHGAVDASIKAEDSIFSTDEGLYDFVLANPPFSVGGVDYLRDGASFKYGQPPKSNADYAFIQAVLKALKPDGRAAMVVAIGVLFRGGVEAEIRKKIILDGVLCAVIFLPSGVFSTTNIPTAILIFDKKNRSESVFFVDAFSAFKKLSDAGFSTVEEAALSVYEKNESLDGVSRRVKLSEMAENDFNLSLARYILPVEPDKHSVQDMLARQEELEAELLRLQKEFREILL